MNLTGFAGGFVYRAVDFRPIAWETSITKIKMKRKDMVDVWNVAVDSFRSVLRRKRKQQLLLSALRWGNSTAESKPHLNFY